MRSWFFTKLFLFLNIFFRVKNLNKLKLLIYTDSRGFNVIGKKGKSPLNSYVQHLLIKYNVTYRICPEKYTTIVDFLDYINRLNIDKYDYVIMHCGVVDFSPRPLSNIQSVKQSKAGKKSFETLFEKNAQHYQKYLGPKYKSEELITLYSKEYFINQIIPQLKKISSLIWINSNHFVPGWDGNYTKGRPENINLIVNSYDELLNKELNNIIDLKEWDEEDIKKYTIDNIHFTREGFRKVYQLINKKIEDLV